MSFNGGFILVMSVMLVWIPAAVFMVGRCWAGRTAGGVVLRAVTALVVLCALAVGLWGLALLVPVSPCDHSTAPECELHTP
ncbi:hypothetical protein OG233_22190 [Streptomyces sp. NBC_01218]|uniref:hypothetical protein n=1 Tax=unclassified Streptomyces TaxID=2593676 RepID=UPI0023B9AA7E|nr:MULTISPECIES: hypothetical protein [unclassified Streptomyces]WEH42039.1 hypothetical protein PZB77_22470 [Streptomyces sp. AM 2-1-1]WSQ53639.1 hypothetical protein OG233_22190 [Streptomyces sp. NBC_01218]